MLSTYRLRWCGVILYEPLPTTARPRGERLPPQATPRMSHDLDRLYDWRVDWPAARDLWLGRLDEWTPDDQRTPLRGSGWTPWRSVSSRDITTARWGLRSVTRLQMVEAGLWCPAFGVGCCCAVPSWLIKTAAKYRLQTVARHMY